MPSILLYPKDPIYPLEPGITVFTDCTRVEPILPPVNFNVVLDEQGIIEGKALLPLMTEMIKTVEQIVADLN